MKKNLLLFFAIVMMVSCSSDDSAESNFTARRISKTVSVHEQDGGTTTMIYKYDGDKIVEVTGKTRGIDVGMIFFYSGNKLTKQSFNTILFGGYYSFLYSNGLINKEEYYDNWNGKSNITFEYNKLKQIIKSTEIDENGDSTITTYKYDTQGNKISATTNSQTTTYEYDDKINPVSNFYSPEVMMVLYGSVHNLTKEDDGFDVLKYVYTYNSSGNINTAKEYENGELITTTTYFYN